MYLSRNVIEKHGGRLTASSEGENQSTTFTFTLPREELEGKYLHSRSTSSSGMRFFSPKAFL
ncbi:MAG: hypothetical protein ACFFFG_18665 [Candidatus Thorarchaeota archaeon]